MSCTTITWEGSQVTAPDEQKAIKVAIKELPVSNPHHQTRLVARKAN